MSEEAEVTAGETASAVAPEPKTDETAKPAVAEPEQTAKDDAPKAEPKEADEEDTDSAGAETDEDEGEESPKPKRLSRTARLIRQREQKDLEIADLRRQLAEREDVTKNPAPKEEDFNGDFEAFNRASIAHQVAETLRRERAGEIKQSINDRQKELDRDLVSTHLERVEEARKLIPDYDAKLEKGLDVDVPPGNLRLLMESGKSELIAYHLAENPERARRFASMSLVEAAKHIGSLEAKLSLPKPRTKTEAPAPVPPVKGSASKPLTPEAADNMDDYVRLRRAEMERKAS